MIGKRKPATFVWREIGEAYQAFNTLCDPADWAAILAAIGEAMALATTKHLRILDVGAGTGLSAEAIRRHLFALHGVTSSWDLVDPDPTVQVLQRALLVPAGEHFGVRYHTSIPSDSTFDIILFLHSTYYIRNLSEMISKCFTNALAKSGVIIIVTMEDHSPFFVPELGNATTGVASEIEAMCGLPSMRYESCALRSRFRWTNGLVHDVSLASQVTHFITGSPSITEREVTIVKAHFSGRETDFRDRLAVVRRR